MPLIQTNNIGKEYVDEGVATRALSGVSLSIEKGEFVAVMGPSGSGKSTLLHILGFLDTPTDGTYHFAGKATTAYSKEEVARLRNEKIGFVFQAFNLLPRTTVLENVKLPLLYSRTPDRLWNEKVARAIQSVGLAHRADYEPSQLSGGEKQRVAIARALVNAPEVLFADEPTGNLDSASGKIVMEILNTLHREHGHTIILITHETATAEHAERIITVRDGKIESDRRVSERRNVKEGFIK